MSNTCQTEYLRAALIHENVLQVVHLIQATVAEKKLEFDTIVFRGLSGALIAPLAAFVLKKELLVVRKTTENCHSWYSIEGNMAMQRYLVIDDCICSGDTLQNIFTTINKEGQRHLDDKIRYQDFYKAQCVGVILYNSSGGRAFFTRSDNTSVTLFHFSISNRWL